MRISTVLMAAAAAVTLTACTAPQPSQYAGEKPVLDVQSYFNVLSLPVGERVIDVSMDDWMFLIDDRVMLNRTAMSKLGVDLGNLTVSFTRRLP